MVRPRIGQGVVVDVPATTANLGPGFDCLGAALDLNNRFAMRCIEGDGERFELVIEGREGAHLRGGPDNLVYRAAQRVWKEAGEDPIAVEARVRLAVPDTDAASQTRRQTVLLVAALALLIGAVSVARHVAPVMGGAAERAVAVAVLLAGGWLLVGAARL